jgi:predicted N-acetyltransferase YhbS
MMSIGQVRQRPYHHETDFKRVRDFLIATFPLTPVGFNWEIRRWEGWCLYWEQLASPPWDQIHLWEDGGGQLVGVAHREGAGEAFLQLHPDYRHLEAEMMAWAETHLAVPTDDGQQRRLHIFAQEYDVPRQRLLEQRGYEKQPWLGITWAIRVGERPYPTPQVPAKYHIRQTTLDDAQRIADVINAGFERSSHTAAPVSYFMRHSPTFRHDLDLVAEAPDGSFAAYVGVFYDEANKRGIFEPVCTAPAHRRLGLARALMLEGLHRLQNLGVKSAYLDTGDMVPANQLYEAVGFTEAYSGYVWRKLF